MKLFVWLTLLCCARPLYAAEPAMLRLANRDIVCLRATVAEQTPQQRVANINARLAQLPPDTAPDQLRWQALHFQGQAALALVGHGSILLALFPADLAPDDPPLAKVAERTRRQLQLALQARAEQDNPRRLLRALLVLLLIVAALSAAGWLLQRARQFGHQRLLRQGQRTPPSPPRLLLLNLARLSLALAHALLWLFFLYSALTLALLQFPYTQPWGQQLGDSVLTLAANGANGVLNAMPGLCTVVAICWLTRLLQRGLYLLFQASEQHQLPLPGLYPETLGATRRLVGVVLWLFALSLAYPYLPGADSEAFKGVSVLFGLMLSLGSAGLVNQAMSGLVLVYSRALKPGDWVQLGDIEGRVSALGPLSTKIVNRLEQEITLPNAVVTAGKIVNHSRLNQGQGMLLATSVTIGYDTPWRQVHAMLALAAQRTPGLRPDAAPLVRQLALQDFYVHYELTAHMQAQAFKPDVLNALHAQIQDVFNQFNVQIMSPNFVMQPPHPLTVATSDWYSPPAQAPQPPDNMQ
jgi:small-conductance mechanosensitive channel